MTLQHVICIDNEVKTIKRVNRQNIELTTGETLWPKQSKVVYRASNGRYDYNYVKIN